MADKKTTKKKEQKTSAQKMEVLNVELLQKMEEEYEKTSKTEKIKLSAHAVAEFMEELEHKGIYSLLGKDVTGFGTYFFLPELQDFGTGDYSKALSMLKKQWRKNPVFRSEFEARKQGELIFVSTIGGKTLVIVKPSKEIEIPNVGKVSPKNWGKKGIVGAFRNGGRATKIGHLFALSHFLESDFDRSPTQKYQSYEYISRYWIVLDRDVTDPDKVRLVTKNGNHIPVPGEFHSFREQGVQKLVEWAWKQLGA